MKAAFQYGILMTCIALSMSLQYGTAQEASIDLGYPTISKGCDSGSGLTQDFHICIGKKKIGEYTTTRLEDGTLTYYCGQSEVEIWLFTSIRIRYELECLFADSILLYSRCVGYRNDKKRLVTEITREGSGWKARQDDGPWVDHSPVYSTMIALYYEEPEVGDKTIIEATLVNKEIISGNDGIYLLKEPGKKRVSELVYREGEISRVNVHFAMKDFSVIRKSEGDNECACKGL